MFFRYVCRGMFRRKKAPAWNLNGKKRFSLQLHGYIVNEVKDRIVFYQRLLLQDLIHDTLPQEVCKELPLQVQHLNMFFLWHLHVGVTLFSISNIMMNHFQMIPGLINSYGLSIICEFFNFFDVLCHTTKSWIPIPCFCFVKFGCWKTHDACRLHPCFRAVGGLLGWIMRRCFLKAERRVVNWCKFAMVAMN